MWHAIPRTSALPLLKAARLGSLGQGPALHMCSASLFAGVVLHAPGMHIKPLQNQSTSSVKTWIRIKSTFSAHYSSSVNKPVFLLCFFPMQRAGEAGETDPHTFSSVTGADMLTLCLVFFTTYICVRWFTATL